MRSVMDEELADWVVEQCRGKKVVLGLPPLEDEDGVCHANMFFAEITKENAANIEDCYRSYGLGLVSVDEHDGCVWLFTGPLSEAWTTDDDKFITKHHGDGKGYGPKVEVFSIPEGLFVKLVA